MTRRKTIFAVPLLLIVLSAGFPGIHSMNHPSPAGQQYTNAQGNHLVLGNSFLELTFDLSAKGNLISFVNKLTNFDLIGNKSAADSLWLGYTTSNVYFGSGSMGSFQWSLLNNATSATARFSWQNFGTRPITVNANVTVLSNSSDTYWSLGVVNQDTNTALHSVFFPFFYGITFLGSNPYGDRLVLPDRNGLMIKNPFLIEPTWWGESIRYPDTLSMQFLLFYKEGLGGFYLASHDGKGYMKEFEFQHQYWPSGLTYKMGLRTFVENAVQGASYKQPYPIVIGVFAGKGWQEGVASYRDWALKQSWASRGAYWNRTDVPDWWKNGIMMWRGASYTFNSQGQVVLTGIKASQLGNMAAQMRTYLPKGDLVYNLWGWNSQGNDRGYPELFPPRDGVAALKQGVQDAHSHDVRVMLYVNARLIDVNTSTYSRSFPYAIWDQNGRPVFEQYDSPPLNATVADPSTDFWKQTMLNISLTLVRDYRVDGIYFDQGIGPPIPSFNPIAPHPIGGGTWWIQSRIDMYQLIRSEIRKYNPQAIITVENENEMLIPYVDGYNSVDTGTWFVLRDWMSQYGKGTVDAEYISLFPYVYGSYSPIRFGSYDPTPVSWGGVFTKTSDWSQSVRVLRGAYPTLSIDNIFTQSQLSQPSMLLQVGLAYARASYLSSWLRGGQILDEYALGSNTTYSEWGFSRFFNITSSTIVAALYKSPSGALSVISINLGEIAQKVVLNPDYARWNVSGSANSTSSVSDNFATRTVLPSNLSSMPDFTISPRALRTVEMFSLSSRCSSNCNLLRSITFSIGGATTPLTIFVAGQPVNLSVDQTQTFYAPLGVVLNVTAPQVISISNATREAFASWNGVGSSSMKAASFPLVVNSSLLITATYLTQYQVLFGANPPDFGSTVPLGNNWYDAGLVIGVSATAKNGYAFWSWNSNSPSISFANASSPSTTVRIGGPGIIAANFEVIRAVSSSTIAITTTSSTTSSKGITASTGISLSTSNPSSSTSTAMVTTSSATSSNLPILLVGVAVVVAIASLVLVQRRKAL